MQQTATLNEKEIYEAIYEYASKQVNFSGMSHKTEVIAGRGERGLYAIITLEPQTSNIINIPKEELDQMIHEVFDAPFEDEGVPVKIEEDDIDPDTQVFE